MNITQGIYRHTSTNKLYKVLGLGRHVNVPNKQVVIYEQLYESKLKNNNHVTLDVGSIWVRDLDSFCEKFVFTSQDSVVFAHSGLNNHEVLFNAQMDVDSVRLSDHLHRPRILE